MGEKKRNQTEKGNNGGWLPFTPNFGTKGESLSRLRQKSEWTTRLSHGSPYNIIYYI